jgi:hypothetical protein
VFSAYIPNRPGGESKVSFWVLIISLLFLAFVLPVSICLALDGFISLPKQKELREDLNDFGYFFFLMLVLIAVVGMFVVEFYRSEISPLPWRAFISVSKVHGFNNGIFAACSVLIADLWLLWIPANMWINNRPHLDKQKRYIARVINLLIGFLLMTASYPAIKFLGSF